jgi:acetolactate synthase-1/2/3 large subunit
MTAAESCLRAAARAGAEICFANPGTTEMALVAALDRVPEIRAVLCLFEGVCTGAADGYGRMAERPALTLLHLGPGLANGLANLHNARRARTPVVNLVGDHASWHLAADAPLTSDIAAMAGTVSGWVRKASSAKRLADDMDEAIAAATGPPGCVATLIVPSDFASADGPGIVRLRPHHRESSRGAAPARTDGVARRLRGAAKALILLGDAALRARALQAAARVAATSGAALAAETFPARFDRGVGLPAVQRLPYFPEQARAMLGGYDCVVLAGASAPVAFFGYEGQPSQLAAPEALIELCRPGEDCELALTSLANELGASIGAGAPATAERPAAAHGALNPAAVGRALARHLPEHAIVVDEAATSGLSFYLDSVAAPPHSVLALTGGAIGQGLPCATGAALACPDRRVIAFQADGSAQYTLQALWTMAREGLNVTILLCSNRSYRILQVELARAGVAEPGPKARSLTNLAPPELDWVALARGYGVPAARITSADELERALPAALAEPGPRLLELML